MVEKFEDLSLVFEVTHNSVRLGMLKPTSDFLRDIKEIQKMDVNSVDHLSSVNHNGDDDFRFDKNGILKSRDKVYVPDVPELERMILKESHKSSLSIPHRVTTMYQDLKKTFWMVRMKRDIAQFIYACLTCQKLKIEHQK